MGPNKEMTMRARGNSFRHAINGLRQVIKEPNALLHVLAGTVVVIAGAARHLDAQRWAMLALAIGLVLVAEAINTAIETLCDFVHDKPHPAIKTVKDISAGAVLIAATVSAVTGIIVFFF